MEAFQSHRGIIAPLDTANVDTDQIIAKQFLKSIKRTGFGDQLFYDWRYQENGEMNKDFPLNFDRYKNASILVARNNFGCGSSREHAVWAVQQYGFKAVIAPSKKNGEDVIPGFADIFRNNCSKNGLLTIQLSEAEVDQIFEQIETNDGLEASIDLASQSLKLHGSNEKSFQFEMDPAIKERLLNGLDDIGLTLKKTQILRNLKKHTTLKFNF